MTNAERPMEPGAGNLGLTRRSYERLYYNARRIVENVDYLVHRMAPWARDHVLPGTEHRRIVGRMIMRSDQFTDTMRRSHILRENLEAVVPVGEYHGSPIVMAMWGVNRETERTLVPMSDILSETENNQGPECMPAERIDALRQRGYQFVNSLDDIQTERVLSLWGPIFEWHGQDIDALRERLQRQRTLPSEERSVWFTAVLEGSEVVALAMAERLNLPLGDGQSVSVIESTEWCVRPGWQHQGLGIGAISHVHAQVLEDLANLARPPIILAETNFTSRADRLGHSAGMIVADRIVGAYPVPQVLRQNVAIGDGLRDDRLRDFTMMYIPSENAKSYYSSRARRQILGRII